MDVSSSGLKGAVDRGGIPNQVVKRVLELVRQGTLKPGQKLPAERDLAQSMGVGRPSLREALRALALLGVLDIRQGEGVFVAELSPESLLEPLQFFLTLDPQSLDTLFEARIAIEAGIAEIAAEKASDSILQRIVGCMDRGTAFLDDPAAFSSIDAEFHNLIVEATSNPFLKRVSQSFQELGKVSREITVNLPGVRPRSHEDHEEILDALLSRDAQGARDKMRRHLENVQAAYHLSLSTIRTSARPKPLASARTTSAPLRSERQERNVDEQD